MRESEIIVDNFAGGGGGGASTGIELASVRSLVVRVRQSDTDKKVCKKLCIGSKSV